MDGIGSEIWWKKEEKGIFCRASYLQPVQQYKTNLTPISKNNMSINEEE